LNEAERAHAGAVVLHHPILLAAAEEIDAIAVAVRKVYANGDLLLQAATQPSEPD
jgi:hypothetical protein